MRERDNKFFLQKRHFFVMGLVALVGWGTIKVVEKAYRNTSYNYFRKDTEVELEAFASALDDQYQDYVDQLFFLDKLVKSLITDSSRAQDLIASVFTSYANNYPPVHQVRILDSTGMERLKVEKDMIGSVTLMPDQELQDKSGRYYFEALAHLAHRDAVYTSPIDLNVEHNKIITPYQPTIRIGKNLFLPAGILSQATLSNKAHLLINYNFNQILTPFQNASMDLNRNLYIVNSQGYYLFAPSPEKEWGDQLGNAQYNLVLEYGIELTGEGSNSIQSKSGWFNSRKLSIGGHDYYIFYHKSQAQIRSMLRTRLKATYIIIIFFFVLVFLFYLLLSKWLEDRNAYLHNLKIKNQQLSEMNAHQDQVYSIIGHDLRSPFTVIIGFGEILVNNFEDLPGKQVKEFLSLIYEASKRTLNMLDNLLLWSRSASEGLPPIVKKPMSVSSIVKTALQNIQLVADNKNIRIIDQTDKDVDVLVDQKSIEVILRNLLSNAVKFTPKQGTITIKGQKADNEFYQFSITDTGIGIPPEMLASIFDKNVEKTRTGTNMEKGTGLGLSLCKNFVELNGGTISVQSKENEGSTFSFTVTIYQEDQVSPKTI